MKRTSAQKNEDARILREMRGESTPSPKQARDDAVDELVQLLTHYVGTADMEGREIARDIIHKAQLQWERDSPPERTTP